MTDDSTPFPTLPASELDRDGVVRYLTGLAAQGHRVFSDPKSDNVFYIQVSEAYRIRVSSSSGRSQIQLHYLESMLSFLDASSLEGVDSAISTLAQRIPGLSWPSRPTRARVRAETPATNYATVSRLVGSAGVDAVFDPYLTNEGLEQLITILSFGSGSISNNVRLLGSTETTRGSVPRFTKSGVEAWLTQLGVRGEARVVAAKSEHRRFMLLNSGQSLLLGQSLNSIHKNEAIRLEADIEDRPFFDTTWAAAAPLT